MKTTKQPQGYLYVTPSGKARLAAELTEHLRKCRELGKEVGASRTHTDIGNAGSARIELLRQLDIEQKQLNDLEFRLSLCKVVYPPKDASRVEIGVNVTIQRLDTDGNRCGNPEKLHVGGHGSTDTHTMPRTVSYESALLSQLMYLTMEDARGGVEVRFEDGRRQYIDLLSIELPAASQRSVLHAHSGVANTLKAALA